MNRGLNVLIIVVTSLAVPLAADAQSWSTAFGPPPGGQGLNYWGSALCVYQDRLVVGGNFTQAGSVSANRVAAWDGTQWSAFGSGIGNGWVEALTEYNGELIAAGDFTQAGGNPAMGLARWNGSSWSALTPPGPMYCYCYSTVCSHDGLLFVLTGDDVSSLSWWNGSAWSSAPMPTYSPATYYPPEIYAMASYQGRLYVAGGVLTRNPGEVNYEGFLFSWDGSSFQGPGYVFDDYASCLQVHNQQLYVGGYWSVGGSPPITQTGVAIWDGTGWVPFGREDISGSSSLDTYHNRLVVGDWRVTSYLGTTEIPLGINTIYAYDTQVYNGDLYVTGNFTVAGSTPSYYIAKWSEPVTAVRDHDPSGLTVISAPNPFNPFVTLSIQVPTRAHVTVIICDATGRKVRSIAMETLDAGVHDVTWDGTSDAGEELASGVYFARVAAGPATVTRKLVLLK